MKKQKNKSKLSMLLYTVIYVAASVIVCVLGAVHPILFVCYQIVAGVLVTGAAAKAFDRLRYPGAAAFLSLGMLLTFVVIRDANIWHCLPVIIIAILAELVRYCGKYENLPFEENSFDVIICCESFHHYPNPQDFFDSVSRVLRPGGRLVLRDMAMNSAAIRWLCNNIEMPLAHLIGKGDVLIYGRNDIRKLCKNAVLHMESFEKRGFCRLHCVVRKTKCEV